MLRLETLGTRMFVSDKLSRELTCFVHIASVSLSMFKQVVWLQTGGKTRFPSRALQLQKAKSPSSVADETKIMSPFSYLFLPPVWPQFIKEHCFFIVGFCFVLFFSISLHSGKVCSSPRSTRWAHSQLGSLEGATNVLYDIDIVQRSPSPPPHTGRSQRKGIWEEWKAPTHFQGALQWLTAQRRKGGCPEACGGSSGMQITPCASPPTLGMHMWIQSYRSEHQWQPWKGKWIITSLGVCLGGVSEHSSWGGAISYIPTVLSPWGWLSASQNFRKKVMVLTHSTNVCRDNVRRDILRAHYIRRAGFVLITLLGPATGARMKTIPGIKIWCLATTGSCEPSKG